MSNIGCPAFFTTVFSSCLMAAYFLMPSPILTISLVLFLPLATMVVVLTILEYYQHKEKWISAGEESETNPTYSYYCSLLK